MYIIIQLYTCTSKNKACFHAMAGPLSQVDLIPPWEVSLTFRPYEATHLQPNYLELEAHSSGWVVVVRQKQDN